MSHHDRSYLQALICKCTDCVSVRLYHAFIQFIALSLYFMYNQNFRLTCNTAFKPSIQSWLLNLQFGRKLREHLKNFQERIGPHQSLVFYCHINNNVISKHCHTITDGRDCSLSLKTTDLSNQGQISNNYEVKNSASGGKNKAHETLCHSRQYYVCLLFTLLVHWKLGAAVKSQTSAIVKLLNSNYNASSTSFTFPARRWFPRLSFCQAYTYSTFELKRVEVKKVQTVQRCEFAQRCGF